MDIDIKTKGRRKRCYERHYSGWRFWYTPVPIDEGDEQTALTYFMETYNEKDMKEAGMAWNDLEIGIKWLEMKGKYKSSAGEKATRWRVARHGT